MPRALILFFLLVLAASRIGAEEPQIRDVEDPAKIALMFPADADLRIVNLWATWCVPCVAEMKDLSEVRNAFRGRGVEIVGVSLDDAIPGGREVRRGKVERFVTGRKIGFPIAYYTGRTPPLLDYYDVSGELPVTLLFDRAGREVGRIEGQIERAAFETEIIRILNAKR